MLPNYDAKAIAEVMGLAFVRKSDDDCSPAGASKAAKGRRKSVSATSGHDFVFQVDDATMLIVEIKKNTLAPFDTSEALGRHVSQLKSCRVSSPSPVLIEKAVESGLPRKALRHVAEWIAGGDQAKVSALEWGVVPKTTLDHRQARLSPQESERTERVARLFVHARRALGTDAEAREFMTTPHPELDGRSPIDAAKTDLGTRRTEQILNASNTAWHSDCESTHTVCIFPGEGPFALSLSRFPSAVRWRPLPYAPPPQAGRGSVLAADFFSPLPPVSGGEAG